jgi:murein DD-endopeptidase MepM/ murein hydrolase activator NlpD
MSSFFHGMVLGLSALLSVYSFANPPRLNAHGNPEKSSGSSLNKKAVAKKKPQAGKKPNKASGNKQNANHLLPKTKINPAPIPDDLVDELSEPLDDPGQEDDDDFDPNEEAFGTLDTESDLGLPFDANLNAFLPGDGFFGHVDADASIFFSADPASLDLLWPVETRTISSAWGPRVRYVRTVVKDRHGNKRRISRPYNSVHKGIDFTAPLGHSVFAAMDGQISEAGRNKKLGNYVRIYHGNGVETVYGHNRANLVKVGDLVRRGQIIARDGSTGRSSGPHVHFEVRINNQQINPMPWLNDGEEIPAEILALNDELQIHTHGGR